MGPGQEGTWNKVPPPSKMTEGMQPDPQKPNGWAGSANMSSVETPDRPEQAGGMKSKETTQAIGRGGVGKSALKSPPADPDAHMLKDGGKY